jgi:Ca2+-binding EF-hand superfamily protein
MGMARSIWRSSELYSNSSESGGGGVSRALMTKLDKDGDGKINLEEFRTLFKQQLK